MVNTATRQVSGAWSQVVSWDCGSFWLRGALLWHPQSASQSREAGEPPRLKAVLLVLWVGCGPGTGAAKELGN